MTTIKIMGLDKLRENLASVDIIGIIERAKQVAADRLQAESAAEMPRMSFLYHMGDAARLYPLADSSSYQAALDKQARSWRIANLRPITRRRNNRNV